MGSLDVRLVSMRERASLRRTRQRKYTLIELQPYLEIFSNRHVVAQKPSVFGLASRERRYQTRAEGQMRLIPKPKPNDGNDYRRHFGAISGFRTV